MTDHIDYSEPENLSGAFDHEEAAFRKAHGLSPMEAEIWQRKDLEEMRAHELALLDQLSVIADRLDSNIKFTVQIDRRDARALRKIRDHFLSKL